MFKRVFFLLLVVSFIEIWGIITVGRWIGFWSTAGLIVLTSLIGAWLTKKEGLQTIQLLRLQLSRNEVPGQSLLDGVCILAGGILLISPGFLTDLIGFLLLIPYTRGLVKAWLIKKFSSWIQSGRFIIINNRKH